MKLFLRFCVFLALCAVLITTVGAQGMPKMSTVEPDLGKAGDHIIVKGENLSKKNVAEIYLTDGKNDLKLPIVEQAAEAIKFRIPPSAKAGRFALMILTSGPEPKLIEQPVKVTVE